MGNANTDESKRQRVLAARKSEARVIEAGGKPIHVLLKPDANALLQQAKERTGKSIPAIIHELIRENLK